MIVAAFAVCTTVTALAEFYGGKSLQKKIKSKLEDWWLRLSDIRSPNVGLVEASFSDRLLSVLLGGTKSWRLGVVSVVITCATASTILPPPWEMFGRYPIHASNIFIPVVLYLSPLVGLSLTITHSIIVRSMTWFAARKYGSLWFLLTLIGAMLLSYIFFMAIVIAAVRLFYAAGEQPLLEYALVSVGTTLSHVLVWVRMGLFALFVMWVLLGWVLVWLKLTIYRLFEAEKGALTVFSGTLTAASAGVKWLVDHWT